MNKAIKVILMFIFFIGATACANSTNEEPATEPRPTATYTVVPGGSTTMTPAATAVIPTDPTQSAAATPPTESEDTPAPPQMGMAAAPAGLMYQVIEDGIYQIQANGQHRQLLDANTISLFNHVQLSPNGRFAAAFTDTNQLVLINTTTGTQELISNPATFSSYFIWGDEDTLLIGVWLDPNEAEGPNNGHIATFNIHTRALQVLDETKLSTGRPALLTNYNRVAFDVVSMGPDDIVTGRLYHPDSGVQVFDPASFTASNELFDGPLFNPAWSPDGDKIAWLTSIGERFAVQLYDLDAQTAVQIHDWDPTRFGALVPSPVWSPNEQWLALEIWANEAAAGGLWLLAADGSGARLVDPQGSQPQWVSDEQLLFNLEGRAYLFDLAAEQSSPLDLPAGSSVIGWTDPADLAGADTIQVADTPVNYVLAMQDVLMYSGPSLTYDEIGIIFDGQIALVTGQSMDSGWWRVICPDDSIGSCWVTADPAFTTPTDGPELPGQEPTPAPTQLELITDTVASPNGRWQAIAARSEPVTINQSQQLYVSLTVTDGEIVWQPVMEWRSYGLGYTWVSVYQWSADNRYLYFTNLTAPDGCPVFVNGTDLYRLDITNGSVDEIIPPGRTQNISLSPDESDLVFTTFNGQQYSLVWRDLEENTEQAVTLTAVGESVKTAEILWSVNGTQVVLPLVYDACLSSQSNSIVQVDLDTMTITTLIEKDPRLFRLADAPSFNQSTVQLVDKDGDSWLLDVNSGQLTAAE